MFPFLFLLCFSLFLSVPFVFLFAPQILHSHPTPLAGDPNHRPLRRSPAAGVHSVSHDPKPKIAFLFLTNSNLSFAPLWEKFFRGNQNLFNIYVHSDPSVTLNPPGGVFRNRFIPSEKTYRASPSLIAATRRLIAAALADDPSNQYLALVSQHCVTIRSFRFVYGFLFEREGESRSRNRSFIEIISDEPNLVHRYLARGGAGAMLPEVPFEEFRVGSQFFVLTRRHAALVVEDRRVWRKFKLPCVSEEPCYPEEHYFPTLLSMEDPNGCTRFTLTRVNWTGCWDGHPHLYSPAEVSPELVRQLRVTNSSYSYLFARKFSPECLPTLMDMADDVIFRD